MGKKINFAIIGCGRIAYRHIEAIEANKNAELVAVCDLDITRMQDRIGSRKIKTFINYNNMLRKENIDVVCILTPSGMHDEHAIDIISQYKKHIVLEKPMALSVKQGEELNKRREFAIDQGASDQALQLLDKMSSDYEQSYGIWF